jgi:hypothetical protein
MGFVRFILWTATAMGLGVLMATVELGNRTPLEHLQRAWATHSSALKKGSSTLEEAKQSVSNRLPRKPMERVLGEERDALNKLIAKQGPEK